MVMGSLDKPRDEPKLVTPRDRLFHPPAFPRPEGAVQPDYGALEELGRSKDRLHFMRDILDRKGLGEESYCDLSFSLPTSNWVRYVRTLAEFAAEFPRFRANVSNNHGVVAFDTEGDMEHGKDPQLLLFGSLTGLCLLVDPRALGRESLNIQEERPCLREALRTPPLRPLLTWLESGGLTFVGIGVAKDLRQLSEVVGADFNIRCIDTERLFVELRENHPNQLPPVLRWVKDTTNGTYYQEPILYTGMELQSYLMLGASFKSIKRRDWCRQFSTSERTYKRSWRFYGSDEHHRRNPKRPRGWEQVGPDGQFTLDRDHRAYCRGDLVTPLRMLVFYLTVLAGEREDLPDNPYLYGGVVEQFREHLRILATPRPARSACQDGQLQLRPSGRSWAYVDEDSEDPEGPTPFQQRLAEEERRRHQPRFLKQVNWDDETGARTFRFVRNPAWIPGQPAPSSRASRRERCKEPAAPHRPARKRAAQSPAEGDRVLPGKREKEHVGAPHARQASGPSRPPLPSVEPEIEALTVAQGAGGLPRGRKSLGLTRVLTVKRTGEVNNNNNTIPLDAYKDLDFPYDADWTRWVKSQREAGLLAEPTHPLYHEPIRLYLLGSGAYELRHDEKQTLRLRVEESEFPVLSSRRCVKCGERHSPLSTECLYLQIALGRLQVSLAEEEAMMCKYCVDIGLDRGWHKTSMCRILHSLCSSCRHRGHHHKICAVHSEVEWEDYFQRHAQSGLYTRHYHLEPPNHRLRARWGFNAPSLRATVSVYRTIPGEGRRRCGRKTRNTHIAQYHTHPDSEMEDQDGVGWRRSVVLREAVSRIARHETLTDLASPLRRALGPTGGNVDHGTRADLDREANNRRGYHRLREEESRPRDAKRAATTLNRRLAKKLRLSDRLGKKVAKDGN